MGYADGHERDERIRIMGVVVADWLRFTGVLVGLFIDPVSKVSLGFWISAIIAHSWKSGEVFCMVGWDGWMMGWLRGVSGKCLILRGVRCFKVREFRLFPSCLRFII
jgi:hypothetical protein